MANLSRSEVKTLSSVERELSIVISSESIKREMDQAYQRLSTQVRLKGFRPGKVPRNVLEHYYKADVEKDVLNRLLNKSYQEAVVEHSLDPVSEPQVKMDQTFAPGVDFAFKATFEIRPQIELKVWEGLELSVTEFKLDDALIDAEIEAMRDAHATIVPVSDRDAILQGDLVECSFSGTVDGAHLKTLSALNQTIEVGSGRFFPHAEQALVGRKLNETVEVNVTLPENFKDEAYRGKEAVLTIVPASIKAKQKPELDDEFAKDVSDQFNSLEDLRSALRSEMAQAKASREKEMKENAAIEALVLQNPFDVPNSLIQRQAEQQAQRALASLPREQAESIWRDHAAALTEEAKPMALKTVRATLLCDAIAKAQNIDVDDAEIDREFTMEAARMKVSVHKLRSYYNPEDIEAMRRRLAAAKALALVVEKAHVKVVQHSRGKLSMPSQESSSLELPRPATRGEGRGEGSRVFIETFGCQMNELDTQLVGSSLKQQGYELVGKAEDANVVFFNTCSVRDLSEQKVLSRLGIVRQRKLNGEKVVVGVIGCMAERAGTDLLTRNPFIDILAGPSKLHEIPSLLEARRANPLGQTQVALSNFKKRKGTATEDDQSVELEALDALRPSLYSNRGSSQAYIRITRGCNKFCSFCVVPRTRGPEVHRSAQSIIDEAKRLVEAGTREVTLLGQTINHYFHNENGKLTSFAELLFRLHEEIPELPRLRFLTSYPRDFTDEALDVMASCERICKYLHIPAQSGSDPVLKRMNRGYTREIYMGLIERAKKRMPGLSIVGDMIVGFPGETDADFEASLDLLSEVQYKNVFVFKYSTRPGTVAQRLGADELPVEVKNARHQRMLDFQNEIALNHHVSMIGKVFPILVEGNAKISPGGEGVARLSGRTTGDHIVAFDGPESLIGKIVNVRAEKASSLAVVGTLIN